MIMSAVVKAFIYAYKTVISPLKQRSCRYYPSCSSYALDAIEAYGALRGSLKALKRIMRCNPFHPGGFDPLL